MVVGGDGFTVEEIREFVHEYQLQPHGTKTAWLAARGVSRRTLARWRVGVYEGDMERGRYPREGTVLKMSVSARTTFERHLFKEREAHAKEVADLRARVEELEGVNTALGKAIGLLHALNEAEPDVAQPPGQPGPSSR